MRGAFSLQHGTKALLTFLLPLACIAFAAAAPTPSTTLGAASHPDLLQLTASNWTDSISNGAWLIEFYTPYCAHCKAFLPLWMELTKNKADLETNFPDAPFRLAQVDCHANRQLCVDEEVPHTPRLTVYRDGKQSQAEYQGDREYTELAKWIDEEAKLYRQIKGAVHIPHPSVSVFQKPLPAPSQQPASDPSFAPPRPQPSSPAPALEPPIPQAAGPDQAPQVPPIAQPPPAAHDEPPPPQPQSPPPPPPIDETLPNPRGQLLRYGVTPGLTTIDELRQWLGVAADAQDYGINYGTAKNKLDTPITAENTNEGSHGTGSLEKASGSGGARLSTGHFVNADNVNDTLLPGLADRKDTISKGGTFVKFFAPWCPHCKAMAQAFEKLAPELKNQLNVLEVDCQAYQMVCRSFSVASYPTLRLYSPVNRLVSEYRGSRSFEKMRDWCHKAAEEEVVDLYEARDERQWDDDISRREEVRFLWLTDEPQEAHRSAWEQERRSVTVASKKLFTSPFKVYRSSHPELLRRFESRLSSPGGGQHRSALLAFRDHHSKRPVAVFYPQRSKSPEGRTAMESWLDWNRYPTLSTIGGESWVDVMNNAHGAPVVLALLSEEQHDGVEYPTGSGSAKRRAEIAALKRMAIAWREEGWQFRKKEDTGHETKYASNGGLLWGWMDSDRWRKAVKQYYGVGPSSFPSLVLVDNEKLIYYPLPTNRPSEVVDLKVLEPLPKVPTTGAAPGAAAEVMQKKIVSEWRSKMSYLGESSEISTWLGRGGSAPPEILESLPSSATSHIVDDLTLLSFIAAIARGEHNNLARSSRSYLDRGVQSIEALVMFSVRHWFLSLFFIVAVVALLAVYVRSSSVRDAEMRNGGYYKGALGRGGSKAD